MVVDAMPVSKSQSIFFLTFFFFLHTFMYQYLLKNKRAFGLIAKFKVKQKMKSWMITFLGGAFIVGNIVGYSELNLSENYVEKVVVHAKWGNKRGEIGLIEERFDSKDIYREGPQDFFVRENDIYILDNINRVIHKHSLKNHSISFIPVIDQALYADWDGNKIICFGKKMYVDAEENIYLYDTVTIKEGLAKVYNKKGRLIKAYQWSKDGLLASGIYIDNGIVYAKGGGEKVCQIGTKLKRNDKVYLHQTDIKTIEEEKGDRQLKVRVNIKPLKELSKFIPREDEIYVEVPPWLELPAYLLGIDKEGNIYLLFEDIQEDKYKPAFEVYKYGLDGKIVARIKMKKDLLPYRNAERRFSLDNTGNRFFLISSG